MEDAQIEFLKQEEIKKAKEQEETKKIEELSEVINSLQFFSDQVRFNSVLFNGFNIMLEKLTVIEEEIKAIKKNSKC